MVPHTNIILPGYDTGKLDMLVIGSSMIVMGGVVLLLDPRVIGVSQLLFSLVSGSGLLIVIFTKIAIISQGNSCKYWAIIKKAPVAPGDHLQLAVRTCNGELREKKLLAVVQVRRIASKGRASVMGLKVLDFTFADQDGEEYLKLEWQIPEDLQRPTAGMKSDIPEFQIEVRALTFTLRYEIPFVEVAGQPSADPAFSLPPLSAQPV